MIEGNYEPRVIGRSDTLTIAFLPNQPSDSAVALSLMPLAYDGNPVRIETLVHYSMPDDPDDIGKGLWLQGVEGCGYDCYFMTPEEAEQLAIQIEKECRWVNDAKLVKRYSFTQVEAALVADLLRQGAIEARENDPR